MSGLADALDRSYLAAQARRDPETGRMEVPHLDPLTIQPSCFRGVLYNLEQYIQTSSTPELLNLKEELTLLKRRLVFIKIKGFEFQIRSYFHPEENEGPLRGELLRATNVLELDSNFKKVWVDGGTGVDQSSPLNSNPPPPEAIAQIILQAADHVSDMNISITAPRPFGGRYRNLLPRFPENLLLAHLVVIWNTNPPELLRGRPAVAALADNTLPAVESNLELPSKLFRTPYQTLVKEITWFGVAPRFEGSLKLLGTKGYYNHRPMYTSVSIHLLPVENLVLKALFLFSNTGSLTHFSDRLDRDQSPVMWGIQVLSLMLQHLAS